MRLQNSLSAAEAFSILKDRLLQGNVINLRDRAHKEGLGHRLGSAAGGREVGAGVQWLAALAAAAKQAAAAAGIVHLVLLPSIHLHPAYEGVKDPGAA